MNCSSSLVRAYVVTLLCLFSVEGHLPLQLNCSFPAKWFKVENVIKRDINGSWKKVVAAKEIADNRCKDSRIVKQGGGSQCKVDNLPGICAADKVKVEFYCWEVGEINHLCLQEVNSVYNYLGTNPSPPPKY